MKILVLHHKALEPPDRAVTKAELEVAPWKTEYDVVRGLQSLGHEVANLGVQNDLTLIIEGVETFKPDIVFNLLEEFANQPHFDQHVVALLEMIGVPYTGCSPKGLMIARDKALAKKILSFDQIPTPEFFVFQRGQKIIAPEPDTFPLFVKSRREEASLGITQKCIVNNVDQLQARVNYFFETYETDAIAERYIEGRELYVSMYGHHKIHCLPIWELHFTKVSNDHPRVATSKVKWDSAYRKRYGIKASRAKALSESAEAEIISMCKCAYRSLELNAYARMDLRLTKEGKAYILEANPNPDIGKGEEFADAAKESNLDYSDLLTKILRLATSRDNV